MSAADLRTPLKRARGLGSAKDGTHDFIVERLSALALVPLTLWMIYLALALVHADYAQARAIVQQPLAAIGLIAFVVAAFWHGMLGMQVVIEDYVRPRWVELVALLGVRAFCAIGAIACVLAVVRIALG